LTCAARRTEGLGFRRGSCGAGGVYYRHLKQEGFCAVAAMSTSYACVHGVCCDRASCGDGSVRWRQGQRTAKGATPTPLTWTASCARQICGCRLSFQLPLQGGLSVQSMPPSSPARPQNVSCCADIHHVRPLLRHLHPCEVWGLDH
jgi:hypothetical protein